MLTVWETIETQMALAGAFGAGAAGGADLDAGEEASANSVAQEGAALLGSVSHALGSHTRRPILIAPETPVSEA